MSCISAASHDWALKMQNQAIHPRKRGSKLDERGMKWLENQDFMVQPLIFDATYAENYKCNDAFE
jgi:hypothetical protein